MEYDVLSEAVILNETQLAALRLDEHHREWPVQGIPGLLTEIEHVRESMSPSAFDRLVLDELEERTLPLIVRFNIAQSRKAV